MPYPCGVCRCPLDRYFLGCFVFAFQENFSRFIGFAKSIMRALPPPEGVPTDLADAHMMFKACDLFDGFYDQLGEEDIRDAMGAALGQAEVMDKFVPARLFLKAALHCPIWWCVISGPRVYVSCVSVVCVA